jgi:hypothetical protein
MIACYDSLGSGTSTCENNGSDCYDALVCLVLLPVAGVDRAEPLIYDLADL